MQYYGYCLVSPGLPSEGQQVIALLKAGVRRQDIYIDRIYGKAPYRPAYTMLRAAVMRRDVIVICGLWALGENCGDIARSWNELVRFMRCDIEVLDCPALSTRTHWRESENLVAEVCHAVLSHLDGISHGRHRTGRPRIERPENFSEVYRQVREGKITNREAMRLLRLKANTYYKFVREEKEGVERSFLI